jgi:hypothetical protein
MTPNGSDEDESETDRNDPAGITYRDPGTRSGTGTDAESGAEDDRETETEAAPEPESESEPEPEPDPEPTNDSEPDADEDEGSGEGGDDADPESISSIDRIRLDPDDVVRTLAYNGQEDVGRKGKAVFSLAPPFGEAVEPAIRHLDEDSTESKADDEIHLRPFRFVVEGRQVVEQRPTRGMAIEELDDDDPTEAAIEAWIDEAMATWKAHVRENFAESVDIFSPHGMAIVDVEYDPEPETGSTPGADPEQQAE